MPEKFNTRMGLFLSILGMAIGAGNIWRFPRLVGKYGSSFILLYFIFNFLWAVPLLMVEFSFGRKTGKGIIGAITKLTGRQNAWLAGFIVVTSTAILFYYSVVTGWTLKYFLKMLDSGFFSENFNSYWTTYSSSGFQPVLFHLMSVLLVGFIIIRGVVKGIEKANKIILPVLFILLLIAVFYAIKLPGAEKGLHYLYALDFNNFWNPTMWIEALSQIAWSTGAGWGLVLTYAAYMKRETPIFETSVFTVIGNSAASLLAATAIIPTLFAVIPQQQLVLEELSKGNLGLTFMALPALFQKLPAGQMIAVVFFFALFLAAVSSMISLFEMLTKIFMDYGLNRKKATVLTGFLNALFGIPAALSLSYFNNQDWVWGLGLLISGLLFGIFVVRWGINNFLTEVGMKKNVWQNVFSIAFKVGIPLLFILMMGFWIIQTVHSQEDWFHPGRVFSLGTCLIQWACVMGIMRMLNSKLARVDENL